ncbi:hypothetical protein ACEN2J_20795, partial [Pseudorhodobacter sp. W20_MBD10_FR17]|uniref:hypothetical protein n=1 Tax=Pseudorhodobacter sp. W20_MBD10_FR17 TaxID=3240266 RepID=UPI003F9C424D
KNEAEGPTHWVSDKQSNARRLPREETELRKKHKSHGCQKAADQQPLRIFERRMGNGVGVYGQWSWHNLKLRCIAAKARPNLVFDVLVGPKPTLTDCSIAAMQLP